MNGFPSLVIFLVNHGLSDEEIYKHQSKLQWINAHVADNFFPSTVTRTKRHFILRYENVAKTRSLELAFSFLSSGDVTITTGHDPQARRSTPDSLREAFRWLYEDQERLNQAKQVVNNLEQTHRQPYKLVGYAERGDDDKIGQLVELEDGAELSTLRSVYKLFRGVKPEGRYVLHVEAKTILGGDVNTIAIDTQVLEKAFYFGEGTRPAKDGIVRRLKNRFRRKP
jgi:hypothetical protein